MLTGEPCWEVYPGCGMRVGTGEGYTGYYPVTLQDPYLTYFQGSGPTYGQMKAISSILMRFPEIGSRIDLEWDPE